MSQRDVERYWTFDLFFCKDIEQLVTERDVEVVTQRLEHVRARDGTPTGSVTPDTASACVRYNLAGASVWVVLPHAPRRYRRSPSFSSVSPRSGEKRTSSRERSLAISRPRCNRSSFTIGCASATSPTTGARSRCSRTVWT